MTAVQIQGLGKVYRGGTRALHSVDLQVSEGEIVAVVGESGCGKSTLLRVVAGLEDATEGAVALFEQPVTSPAGTVPTERRGVAMVFQDHALFPHLRVHANVAFGLRGLPRSQKQARVSEALGLVGLPGLGDRYIHELSGGQRQRVALARALAPTPRIVLLDEPLSSLDERLRSALRDDILRLLRARGTTALWVTHRAEDALTVADRSVVLESGLVVQVGAPEALYHRPVSRYVARMFGPVNAIPASIAPRLGVEGAPAADGAHLVRPEALVLHPDGLFGVIAARRYRGTGYMAEITLDSGDTVLVATASAPTVGTAVGVRCRSITSAS